MMNEGAKENPSASESILYKQIDELTAKAARLVNLDNQQSLEYAEKAHQLSTSGQFSVHPYKKGLADSLNLMSDVNLIFGHLQLALDQGDKAMAIYEDLNDLDGQAKVLSIHGFNYYYRGNYPQAIDCLLKSLKLARQTANLAQQGRSLSFLALVNVRNGEEKKALKTFDESIEMSKRAKDEVTLAITYNNLAMTFSEIGQQDRALDYSMKSLQLCEKLGLHGLKVALLDTIGVVYMEIKNYKMAEKYFRYAVDDAKKQDSYKHIYMVSLLNLGYIYMEMEKEEAALSYLFRSLEIAEEIDSKPKQFRIHKILSNYYEKKGAYKRSLLHYKEYHRTEISVYNQESFEKIKSLEQIHKKDTEKKEAEIYQLKNVELKKKIKELADLNNDLQKAFDEIKTLKGIIPICSSCKKIRDDSGYWNRIESYIQEHSEAEFSHGMCPECCDEFYGKEDWYIELKKNKKIK